MTNPAPARFQFGIRHLLVAMIVVSALAALMGPSMRRWSALQWFWYAAHLVAATAAYVLTLWQRFRALGLRQKQAGEIRWQVPLEWEVRRQLPWWGRVAIAACVLDGIIGILEILSFTMLDAVAGPWPIVCGLTLGLLAGDGIFDETRFPTHARIGENGILFDDRFVPWENFGPPTEDKGEPVRLLWAEMGMICTLLLPADDGAEVRAFVHDRMKRGAEKRPRP